MSVVTRVIYKEETFAANRNKGERELGGRRALHGQKWLKIEINKSIGILQHMLCTCFFPTLPHCSSSFLYFLAVEE